MADAEFAIVLTTVPAAGDVATIARTLVDERLAACVSVLAPMISFYRWQGVVERADERQLVIKTTVARLPALQQRLQGLHPYEVPEIVVIAIASGSAAYLSWLRENCQA